MLPNLTPELKYLLNYLVKYSNCTFNFSGETVKYGKSRAKMPSRMKTVKRDWGKGMATAGRTKICTIVPPTHFGPIPGIEVGMGWQYRMQCAEAGVHRPPVSGIAGSEANGGCVSIVLGGGYEDDVDNGDEFTYTGSGIGSALKNGPSIVQEKVRFSKPHFMRYLHPK